MYNMENLLQLDTYKMYSIRIYILCTDRLTYIATLMIYNYYDREDF